MILAPDWNSIVLGAEARDSGEGRLVSILFAMPDSLVVHGLQRNEVYWNLRTGTAWDLFFAGYFRFGGRGITKDVWRTRRNAMREFDKDVVRVEPGGGSNRAWHFSPRYFVQLVEKVEEDSSKSGARWRYSGQPELLSVMMYGRRVDWLSMRAVRLLDGRGQSGGHHVGQVIEGLRHWQSEEPDGRYAPGQSTLGDFVPVQALSDALRWAGAASLGGAIGLYTEDLIRAVGSIG